MAQTVNDGPGRVFSAVCPICRSGQVTTTVLIDTYPPYAIYAWIVAPRREPFPCCAACRVRYTVYRRVLVAAAAGLGALLLVALLHLGAGGRVAKMTKGLFLVAAYLCAVTGLSYALFGRYYFRARHWIMLNTTPTRITMVAGATPPAPGRLYKE